MPIAPCATAGSMTSVCIGSVMRCGETEPVQPGAGEKRRVGHALLELAQPRLDVAAEPHDLEIRAPVQRSAPAAAATTSRRSRRAGSSSKRGVLHADERVARVLARQRRRRWRGHRGSTVCMSFMECTASVDLAGEQRLLDLLGKETLAAGLRQRPVGDAVAGRLDDDRARTRPRPSPCAAARRRAHLVGLRQRQGRAAGADADLASLQAFSPGGSAWPRNGRH